MKRLMAALAVMTLAASAAVSVGVTAASASQTTPTIKLTDPKAIINDGAFNIVATASVAGTVEFKAGGVDISGCSAVATIAAGSSFVATCSWTPVASALQPDASAPAAAGETTLDATLTPTDTTDYTTAQATEILEVVGAPVQGSQGPIALYVDTIVASGSPDIAIGAGCEIQNEFYVGQTIVFRVYGNDYGLGGAVLTAQNVSSATVTIAGYSGSPLTLSYGNHGGVSFWTAPLKTGTGFYNTLGVISYKVTFNTIAVPAVTKVVTAYKNVVKVVKGVRKVVRVSYKKTIVVTPAVPGETGTFTSSFATPSVLTLNAAPAA